MINKFFPPLNNKNKTITKHSLNVNSKATWNVIAYLMSQKANNFAAIQLEINNCITDDPITVSNEFYLLLI